MSKTAADKDPAFGTGEGRTSPEAPLGLRDLGFHSKEHRIVLALQDFVANSSGEVVVFNDSAVATMTLTTDSKVLNKGTAKKSQTTDGQAISDFKYLTFDNGLTVYFAPELEILVERQSS